MTTTAPAPRVDSDAEQRQAANRAVGVSAVGLAATGALELVLALLTGSVALLGDALHNLSDVSTSAVVFLGFRISRRPPTDRYPYGYDRAEDLAGLGVALVIWLSAVFAGFESYRKLVGGGRTTGVYIGMAGAALGIIGNQVVARYKSRVGRRINSATLVADAKHSWLDALSSAAALIGLGLVAAGYRWGDPIAGLAVTLFIMHVGSEVTGDLFHHLMDGVDPQLINDVRSAVEEIPGTNAARVQGRWTGRTLRLDITADVDPALTVAQADALSDQVAQTVRPVLPANHQITWSARPTTAA